MKPRPEGSRLDNPERNQATLRNLTNGMRFVHVQPWLETVTFDILVEAYWAAQARRADELERAGAG